MIDTLDQLSVSERTALRVLCRRSFRDFVKTFWHVVIAEELQWNWHMDVLCDELQAVLERVFKGKKKLHDLVINIPPGTSKSTICSVMLGPWAWTRMVSLRTIGVSYAAPLALDLSRKGRMVVESELYQELFPKVGELREDQNAKGHYENEHGGMRVAFGTGGVTGYHAHVIVIDDPLNPLEAASDTELKTTNDWIRETLSTRKVDKSTTVQILVMQRLHKDDPSGMYLDNHDGRNSVRHICLPGELSDKVQPPSLKDQYIDGLLDPVRLAQDILEDFKSANSLGIYGYSCQIMQDPIPRGGNMFEVEKLNYGRPPPLSEMESVVRFWDKAGTSAQQAAAKKFKAAYTAGVQMGYDKSKRLWILDVVRGQYGSAQREQTIKSTATVDGYLVVIGIEQEPGSGGKESAERTVENLAGYRVRVQRPVGDKFIRADSFSVQVNMGLVWLPLGAPWVKAYVEELRFFGPTTSKLKDQVDASSGGFSLLTHSVYVVGAPLQR